MSETTDVKGDNASPKFYISEQEGGYCEYHVTRNAGAYLTAEIRQPNNTVSQRYTLHDEGCELIVTPTGSWLVVTAEQGGYCEECQKQEEA